VTDTPTAQAEIGALLSSAPRLPASTYDDNDL
jgi:hypothetical protein